MTDLMLFMMRYVGVHELHGDQQNPVIMKMFHETGHKWVLDDETGWCCAAINYGAMQLNYEYSKKLYARSYLDIGIPIDKPVIGCLVIFWRVKHTGWKGHVGIYMGENKDHIFVMGGNQSNEFNYAQYPKNQLLGYRILKKIL